MEVNVFDQQTDLKLSPARVKKIVSQVISYEGHTYDEVDIHFVDTERICTLHQDYFDDPSSTDCISFPMHEPDDIGYRMLGEVFVCPQAAIDYVKEHGGNPHKETTLYIVHGLLHLMGYDDIGEEEPKMREAERRHMKNLREKDLVLEE